jgi:hypothetical protein
MAEQWILRVEGKEYGPVDLDELREWKDEGRIIRENEIREQDSDRWFRAGELPELFADRTPPPETQPELARQDTLGQILARSWRIYRRGFWQFLGLCALVVVPSVCTQLSSAALGSNGELNLRTALAGLFNFCMFVTSLVAWPLYIAGIQILTSELARGRSLALREVIPQALKFWPRVAVLCILVYGAFFLLMVLAFAILLMVAAGPSSLLVIFFALALLIFQIWMFGRVFANVLFWQQAAVFENAGVVDSLRRSKDLAHRRRDLPWSCRPLWRGVVFSSLWCAFATALSIGPEWSTMTAYFHSVTTMQDPQAILQSMSAAAKPAGLALLPLALGVLQAVLRPLLGIAFVLLYIDLSAQPHSQRND